MELEARYRQILQELAAGGRGLVKLAPEEIDELNRVLASGQQLIPALCLVSHSAYPVRDFEPVLLELMAAPLQPSEHVYVLNAARRHILQGRFKDGHRLELNFLERLRLLLRHPDPEVVEWALRTLEECGAQGVLLSSELEALRPSVFSLWRANKRTILELVTLLQRRWGTHDNQTR